MFPGSSLVLDGLLIAADLEIVKPEPGPAEVVLRDCTVLPGGAIRVVGPALSVKLERSVTCGMLLSRDTQVEAVASVIDATDPRASALSGGGALTCHETTIIGRVNIDRFDMVSNSLLVGERANPGDPAPILSKRRQVGCVRFSWLPFDSEVPQRYRCVPEDADDTTSPIFVSSTHGDARYLQLDLRTPVAITEGSEQQSEMGVLHRMHRRAREVVLADRLDEFLRFGMEAGVHYAS